MIRRDASDGCLLISQVEHARLAGDLAAAWGNDAVPGLPLAEWLVPAVRDHDDGWRAWEAAPDLDDEGRPRDFTEMRPAEAAAVWTRSIDACAAGLPSSAEALRRLRADGGEVTPDDAAVLELVLRHRGGFGLARLTAEAAADGLEVALPAVLGRFVQKGVIRPLPATLGDAAYEITVPAVGDSPLGGLWVGGHFRALADMARERHAGDPDERAAIDSFLADQAGKRAAWKAAARDFAGEELDRLIDTGTRYVRFFDRISLWLCTADRDEPWDATLSSALTLTFTPQTAGGSDPSRAAQKIAVSPWPFRRRTLDLWTPAARLPSDTFAAPADLRAALDAAEPATLRWVLRAG